MVDEAAPLRRRRPNVHGKILRRRRIFAWLREGLSYDEIAAEEGLTATRIRQIVSEVLQKRAVDSGADHAKLQLDRLAPAVQLGAEAIAAGAISAISPYLKALDRLDRYQTVAVANQTYDDEARKKLMEKINRLVENLSPRDGGRNAGREPLKAIGEIPDAPGEAEAAPDPTDVIEEQQDSQGEASQWMSV
jgi:DNA-binding CsgD family transcriptional regulator